MGTNYFARIETCNCCGRYDESHIGKYSYGWEFLFQGQELCSWKEWKKFLKDDKIKIFDEYGKEHSISDLEELIKSNKKDKRLHKFLPQNFYSKDNYFTDKEGYKFCGGDFS